MTQTLLLLSLVFACGTAETPEVPAAPEAPEAPEAPAEAPEAPPAQSARLNLNSATSEELAGIPKMTPRMVHEFEEYRPYISIVQFRKEIGKYVSAEEVAAYEPHVYVPISFNECDAATLAQIPGLEVADAEALLKGRPWADKKAFMKALREKAGKEAAKAANALLK